MNDFLNEIKPTEQQSPVLMFIIVYTVALAFWCSVWPFKWKVLSWKYILDNVNYLFQLNEGLTSEYNDRLSPFWSIIIPLQNRNLTTYFLDDKPKYL